MKKTRLIILTAALGLGIAAGVPQAAVAADVPAVTVLGSATDHLRSPGKIALDPKGVLYVADALNRGVLKFDQNGYYLGLIPVTGVVHSVAVTAEGRVLVSHDSSVSFYSADGVETGVLTGYRFGLPNGIASDADGRIYVADSRANKIAVFTPAGFFVSAFGAKGAGQGELNFPTGLAFESVSGQLAVADTLNNRVQFFDTTGAYRRMVGSPMKLSGPLRFSYPQGVAFDYMNGVRMYVADAYQSNVQVIELGALPRFLSYIGSYGSDEGNLQQPSDVVFDPTFGELLVSDSSGRINIYGISAPAAADPGTPGATPGAGNGTGNGTGTASSGGWFSGTTSGSSTAKPGTAGSAGNATWQYPDGTDCRHARAGSVVCRDK